MRVLSAWAFLVVLAVGFPRAALAAAPISVSELDFWVRAGRGNSEILGEVRQRGLLEAVDDAAQRRLRADGADAALLGQLAAARAGGLVVSADEAARARQELAAQAEKERLSRELVLQQARMAERQQQQLLQQQQQQRQATLAANTTAGATAAGGQPPSQLVGGSADPGLGAALELPAIAEPPGSGADGWKVGFSNARKQAANDHKMVLVDFTGSDWCSWCKKLESEVFATPQFKDYAAKKLVLVRADYPKRRPQSAEVKGQNAKLQEAFNIKGFPTIIVLNSEGKPVGRLGYLPGGPAPFLAELQKLEGR